MIQEESENKMQGKNIQFVMGVMILFLVIILGAIETSAITGNIGNARMVLYPEVGLFGTSIEKTILVSNINDEAINVSLVADSNISEITKIIDENFILQPDEQKDARIVLNINKVQNYDGRINIFFKGLEDKNSVVLSSNIVVRPVKKEIITGKNIAMFMLFASPIVLIIALILLVFFLRKHKKVKKVNSKRTDRSG